MILRRTAEGVPVVEDAAEVEEFSYELVRSGSPFVHWNEPLGVISVVAGNGTWRYRVIGRTEHGVRGRLEEVSR